LGYTIKRQWNVLVSRHIKSNSNNNMATKSRGLCGR